MRDDDWSLYFFTVLVTFGLTVGLVHWTAPTDNLRIAHRTICTYLEGEQQGDVCIRDGEVVKIDLSNFKDD